MNTNETRPYRLLMSTSLGILFLGFVSWMLGYGNASPRGNVDFRYWLSTVGLVLILLGDVGLVAFMAEFSHTWPQVKRFGAFVLVAALLSFLSFVIVSLEYGVLNFGDSDLPPYQPDTPFEKGSISFGLRSRLVLGCSGCFSSLRPLRF